MKIYYSLDEARLEILARWGDNSLKSAVTRSLEGRFMPGMGSQPQASLVRSVISPDVGYDWACLIARYLNLPLLLSEYTNDKFIGLSEEKLALARLRIEVNSTTGYFDIVDFGKYHEKNLRDVMVLTGESLIEFHHALLNESPFKASPIEDVSDYFKSFGKPSDYYVAYLSNFVCHGILLETFDLDADSRENSFSRKVVLPAIESIYAKFGVTPLVVKLYPDNQTADENNFWYSYNRRVNTILASYVTAHSIKAIC